MKKFITTTALGGMLFLIPLVVVGVVLAKAFNIMKLVAAPLDRFIPIDSIAGVGLINILAILIMLLFCLLAGLVAQSAPAKALYAKLDSILLELIPGYAWTKTVLAGISGNEKVEEFKPVLVKLDDMSQVAFEIERSANGLVVVFLPGAPDARSGSVAYVTADRVQAIDAKFLAINRSLNHVGKGSAALLPPGM